MAPAHPDRLRRSLTDLARAGLDTPTFSRATCAAIADTVPYDYACLATTDPATGLITSTVKSHPGDSMDELLARYEYEHTDLNQFADLARRDTPVGVLALDTAGHPDRSPRYREFLLPLLSLGHELRAVFRSATSTWGVIGIYRTTGPSGFTAAEVETIAAVTTLIADGIRTALILAPTATPSTATTPIGDTGPAVVVLGPDDRPRLVTPNAENRIDTLDGTMHGALPMPLLSLAAATRSASRHGHPSPAATRIRTANGGWLSAWTVPDLVDTRCSCR